MEIKDIDEKTSETFFRCMHDEIPEDHAVTDVRKKWFREYQAADNYYFVVTTVPL
jgi:hypothetical protein